MTRHRSDVIDLSTRLIREFEDRLPPGQVISAVVRSQQLVRGTAGSDTDAQICEDIARRLLEDRVRPRRQVARMSSTAG